MRLSPGCKAVLSGRSNGLSATLARLGLAVLALLYTVVMYVRNLLYDFNILRSSKLSVPVICVGNITVGGTGKTPMVIWLCRYLQGRGRRVALLSRGYKSSNNGVDNDETCLLGESLPGVTIIVDSDRVRGGRKAIDEYGVDVIVLDDGFQHRRLRRDLDIVMIDCSCPFGFGWVLPRGLLREPLSGLKRCDAIVLSRSDQVDKNELAVTVDKIGSFNVPVIKCSHRPVGLSCAGGGKVEFSDFAGQKVFAFCGIGNPEAFLKTIESLGGVIQSSKFFDDHENYDDSVFDELESLRCECDADYLLTTEKDWVKLRQFSCAANQSNLYILAIEMALGDGRGQLEKRLDELCQKNPINTAQ